MPGYLDKLYFGKDDAESDFVRGGLLREGFLRTRAFDVALSGEKFLIIGRKGSGKSATCLMVQSSPAVGGRVSVVTPDDVSAEEIRRFSLPGIHAAQSKRLMWRYLFAVQSAKYLIAVSKQTAAAVPEAQETVAQLRRFLVDNREIDDLTITERFWRVIEKLKGSLSVEAFGAKAGIELEGAAPGVRASEQMDIVEEHLARVGQQLQVTSESGAFYLLVDQIEKVWSNDRDSDAMVVGLLEATKHCMARIEWLRCVVFLRADIYEKLQFGDRDKFRGDEFVIDWTADQLTQLLEARAKASAGLSPQKLWNDVLPHRVGEQETKEFFVSRSLMRPRDVIQLANACRDTAKTNANSEVTEHDIRQAVSLYSNWKLSDLQNEWSVNYPFLPDIFVLLSDNSYIFDRDGFAQRLQLIRDDLAARYPAVAHFIATDALLSTMYAIGLIGVTRQGKARYYYQDKIDNRIKPTDSRFIIHPCFRAALQCNSAIDMRQFAATSARDIELLQARVRRGYRIGVYERARGSAVTEVLMHARNTLDELRLDVGRAGWPDEIVEEFRGNFAAMQSEVDLALDLGEMQGARRCAEKVAEHLVEMRRSAQMAGILEERSDLAYRLQSLTEDVERFLYRGPSDFDFSAPA